MIKRLLNYIKRVKYNRAVSSSSIEDRFSNIYKENLWFANKESRSGAGSTLEATGNLRTQLPGILKELETEVLVDVGCGDFHWMKEIPLPCNYIGIDIVKSVIETNKQKYEAPNRQFLYANAVEEPIPSEADTVICREVLFHLSFNDGLKLIGNVVNSNAKYFIATSDLEVTENKDIKTGYFRNINLLISPYNFSPVLRQIADNGVAKGRYLGVWRTDELRKLKLEKL